MVRTVKAVAAKVALSPFDGKKALAAGLVEREADDSFNVRKVRRGVELQSMRCG